MRWRIGFSRSSERLHRVVETMEIRDPHGAGRAVLGVDEVAVGEHVHRRSQIQTHHRGARPVLRREQRRQLVLREEGRGQQRRRDQQHRDPRRRDRPPQLLLAPWSRAHADVVPQVQHPGLLQRLEVHLQLAQEVAVVVTVGDQDPAALRAALVAPRGLVGPRGGLVHGSTGRRRCPAHASTLSQVPGTDNW